MTVRDYAFFGAGAAVSAVGAVMFYGSIAAPNCGETSEPIEVTQARLSPAREVAHRAPLEKSTPPSIGVSTGGTASARPEEQRIAALLAAVNRKLEAVQREKLELENQLQSAQEALDQSATGTDADEFDLDREAWKKLAAEGRIKYRVPCTIPPEYTIPPGDLQKLGLSPEDGVALTEAHRRSNARLWEILRPLCLDALAAPAVVDQLGTRGCQRIIREQALASNKFAETEAQRQVAEVHAGLRARPPPGQSPSPLFATYLALTSESALFERDLADSFGPDEAHRIAMSLNCTATMR